MTNPVPEFLNEQFAPVPPTGTDSSGGAGAFYERIEAAMEKCASSLVDQRRYFLNHTARELAKAAYAAGAADALRITREMQEGK